VGRIAGLDAVEREIKTLLLWESFIPCPPVYKPIQESIQAHFID
jgi:hypothetical protein